MYYNKQKYSNSEVNDNKINVVTHFSQSAGPALSALAVFFILIMSIIFGITMWKHFNVVEQIGFYIVVAVLIAFGVLVISFMGSRSAIFWFDAYERFIESRGQKQRNGILAITETVIAYNSEAPIAIARTSANSSQFRDEQEQTIEGSITELQPAPKFADLLPELERMSKEDWNKPAAEKRICMGFTVNGMRTVLFGDVRSIAVSGIQGFGKSVTLACIALQAVLNGFRLIVVDPHANNEESITYKLRGVVNSIVQQADGSGLIEVLSMVWDELKRRKTPNQVQGSPWMVVMDELPAMVRENRGQKEYKTIEDSILAIVDEGRKYGIFLVAGSQRWKQNAVGAADIRQAFPAQIIHRNAPTEAMILMACPANEAQKVLHLQKGYAYINDSTDIMVPTSIPYTTEEDGFSVARMRPAEISERPRNIIEMSRNTDEIQPETSWEERLERFSEMVARNATKGEILAEIFGNPKPGDNKAYRQACMDYEEMLETVMEEAEAVTVEL